MGAKRSRVVLKPADYKNLCIAVLRRDGWKCRVCKSRKTLSCHHVVYRSHGGDDADWNLLVLCARCHEALHNRHLVILPTIEGEATVNANKDVRFLFIGGWKPGVLKKKKAA